MPDMRSFMRTRLAISQQKQEELDKIKRLFDQKARRLVVQIGDERFNLADCTNVTFDPSSNADAIQFTRPTALPTPAVASSVEIQDLTYTAVDAGVAGDDITITYVDPAGNDEVLAISVVGTDISVSLATDSGGVITSTAEEIKDAIDGDEDAAALVSVAITGDGETVQTAQAQTPLEGGADEIPPGVEYYDLSDIILIKRLRTKKYLIKLAADADPQAD